MSNGLTPRYISDTEEHLERVSTRNNDNHLYDLFLILEGLGGFLDYEGTSRTLVDSNLPIYISGYSLKAYERAISGGNFAILLLEYTLQDIPRVVLERAQRIFVVDELQKTTLLSSIPDAPNTMFDASPIPVNHNRGRIAKVAPPVRNIIGVLFPRRNEDYVYYLGFLRLIEWALGYKPPDGTPDPYADLDFEILQPDFPIEYERVLPFDEESPVSMLEEIDAEGIHKQTSRPFSLVLHFESRDTATIPRLLTTLGHATVEVTASESIKDLLHYMSQSTTSHKALPEHIEKNAKQFMTELLLDMPTWFSEHPKEKAVRQEVISKGFHIVNNTEDVLHYQINYRS